MDLKEARNKINHHKRVGGQYWSNIVSSILKQVADEHGKDKANQLTRDCKLTLYGWREEE